MTPSLPREVLQEVAQYGDIDTRLAWKKLGVVCLPEKVDLPDLEISRRIWCDDHCCIILAIPETEKMYVMACGFTDETPSNVLWFVGIEFEGLKSVVHPRSFIEAGWIVAAC